MCEDQWECMCWAQSWILEEGDSREGIKKSTHGVNICRELKYYVIPITDPFIEFSPKVILLCIYSLCICAFPLHWHVSVARLGLALPQTVLSSGENSVWHGLGIESIFTGCWMDEMHILSYFVLHSGKEVLFFLFILDETKKAKFISPYSSLYKAVPSKILNNHFPMDFS